MVNVNESNDFQSPTNNDPSSWSTRNGPVSSSSHSDPDLHSTQNDSESQSIQIDPDSQSFPNDTEAQIIQNDPESNSTQNDPESTLTQNDPDSTLTQDVSSSQFTQKDTELDSIQNDPDAWSNITNPDSQCSEIDSDPNSDTDTESIEDILILLPAQSDEELPFTEPDNEKQDRPTNKDHDSQFSHTDPDCAYQASQNTFKLLNEKLKSQNKIMSELLSDATDTMKSYGLEKRKQLQRIESLAKDQDLKKKEIKTLKRKLTELEATNVDLERRCITREKKSSYPFKQNHSNYIPGIEYVLLLIQFFMNYMPGKAGADFPNQGPVDHTPIIQEERRQSRPPNRRNFQDRICFQCKMKGHVVADCWKILKNSRPQPRDEIWTRSWYPKKKYISQP